MQDRTARIAARIFKEAAAEEKPPRDDLRKRYKTEDMDRADRKDFSDTAADPDLKAGASDRTASGWTVDKKFDFEYRGKTGHAKVHYTLMSNGRDVDNFSGEIKWDKGGTTRIPETRMLGVYGRYANKEIIDALVKCIREIECGIRDWQGHLKASAALKATPQVGQMKFRYRLYCANSLFSFIAFLPTAAEPELFVAVRRAFEKDWRRVEDSLVSGGYRNLEVYRLEQDETRDGQPILLFRGNLHDSQDDRLLRKAANSVGAEFIPQPWRGESVTAARRVAAGMRAPSRSFLEKEIRQMAAKGVDAAHRLNDNLYLVAEAKGNPRGEIMEFHWQNYRGDSFGFATVEEDRFGQHTPARAAVKLLDDFAKSSLRIFR